MKLATRLLSAGAGLLLGGAVLLGGAGAASAGVAPQTPLSGSVSVMELGGLGDGSGGGYGSGGGGGTITPQQGNVSPLNQSNGEEILPGVDMTKVEEKDKGSVTKYLEGYEPLSDENMKQGSKWAAPLVNIIGTATGFLIVLAWIWVGFQTALDLVYISIPLSRHFLHDGGNNGAGQGMMGAGGGMGSSGGAPKKKQWVSDEATNAVSSLGGSAQAQGQQMGMGGGGFGGGGFGGGAAMSSGQNQTQSKKSVIMSYFGARAKFLVFFGLATVVLLSSFFLDAGLNLGEWAMKVFESFNFAPFGG